MIRVTTLIFFLSYVAANAQLGSMEQIATETFGEMREVERYQLKIAEKYYLKGEFKIALDEYEKFLTLYETSPGAPYAQLMYSHSLVKLRKVNTAIRDGFRSVIDYWPDSREATQSSYLIASSYRNIGETEKAEEAYFEVINKHPDDIVATLSRVDLLKIARTKKDQKRTLQLLTALTYKTKRTTAAKGHAVTATRELASIHFREAKLDEAVKVLETTYQDQALVQQIDELSSSAIQLFQNNETTHEKGKTLADAVISLLEKNIPTEITDPLARDYLNRIANKFAQTGRPKQVLATYQRMIKLLGQDDGLLGKIASWHKSQNQRDAARATYLEFENKISGKNNIAAMWREESQWAKAIETYRELIAEDPGQVTTYLWAIAECYEADGKYALAIVNYDKTDRVPESYFRMANCHRKLKQFAEAESLYKFVRAHHTGPAPEASIQLARTYEEWGKRESAIKTFQQTCKLFPKSGQASQAHSHLQSKYNINITLGGAKDE
ncbi:MAG: TolA-binding protein [Verrucomicrobiales bacterium]|jgi:TolA-binding protein